YRAILLERMRPGFGQTGHSHVFLHEGHMFASMVRAPQQDILTRIESVRQANQLWKTALDTGRLRHMAQLRNGFYVGWADENSALLFEGICKLAHLPYKTVHSPPGFGSLGEIRRFYETESISLESKALLEHLLDYRNLRNHVGYCKDVSVTAPTSDRFHLTAKCDSEKPVRSHGPDESLQIRAGALVLSAGAGNERLVNRLLAEAKIPMDPVATRQQTIKTFMLVVRHPKESLPPVSGMFHEFDSVFMVSRQDEDGRTVWLIGNGRRELVQCAGEMTALDAATWFQGLESKLNQLFPQIIKNANDYEWGVYEATKAEPWTAKPLGEGGKFPSSYHVHRHPTIPIWLTWPTLLTFAPKVASEIVGELKTTVRHASLSTDWSVWNNFRKVLQPSECRWKTTPLLSWKDFTRCFT
ncbi:MAG: hypothetical protein WAM70_10035, partial [Pyrinomonadaceae bacterium]